MDAAARAARAAQRASVQLMLSDPY